MTPVLLLWVLLLTAVVTMVAILQAALSGVRGENLERLIQRHVSGARRLELLLQRPSPLFFSLALAQSAALIVTVMVTITVVGDLIGHSWATALLGGVASLIVLLTLRGLAHIITWPSPERAALRLVWLAYLLVALFRPITLLAERLDRRIQSGSARPGGEPAPLAEGQERHGPVFQGHEVEERERQMIRAILRLEDTSVREIMVPLPDMVAVEKNTPLGAVADLMTTGRRFSRIPVYEATLDHVVGVLYAKDVLAALKMGGDHPPLVEICRPAFLIPETKRLDNLLRDFQERRVHIGVVVDEYGGVAGLVTIEDLLEEIVGEIEDEYDAGEPQIERVSEDEAIMDAKAPLERLTEQFATEIEGVGFDTIGGLIYQQIGKMPVPGDSVVVDGIQIDVLTTIGRRIRKVRVRRLAASEPAEE